MKQCIYCKRSESKTFFTNVEHVIPQAFGVFEPDNLVLTCVCDECNAFFGGLHDQILARDSMEAFGRSYFLKKWPKDPDFKKRRITHRVEEGPFKGMIVHMKPGADGSVEAHPPPQIGIFHKSKNEYVYFELDQIPQSLSEYDMTSHTVEFHCDTKDQESDFCQALQARGVSISLDKLSPNEDPAGKHQALMKLEIRLDSTVARALSKIALNYLAAITGQDVVLRSEFDPIRNWIRYDAKLDAERFFPNQEPILLEDRALASQGKHVIRGGYLLAVGWDSRNYICGRVSFYNLNTYKIILGGPFVVYWPLSSAHYFDFQSHKIIEARKPL